MEVDEAALADFGSYLGAEAGETLPTIEQFARDEGMSDHGFGGVLTPLGDIVNGEASVIVGEGFSLMQRKLCDLGDAVISAAKSYGYIDEENASLFEQNGLEDSGEDVNFGSGNESYQEGGGSSFTVTATDLSAPDRGDAKFADRVDAGFVLDVVNWIWTEFDVAGGKDFTDSILEPLVGNPTSIEANGEAWTSVGSNFGLFASSILDNAAKLLTHHWGGDAADAFREFLSQYWEKGAVWAGEKLGEFVAKGFNKIAEVSTQLAELAIDAINKLLEVAARIAARAIPVIGWAWTAIEAAAEAASWLGGLAGIDIDIDSLWNDIQEIIDLAQKVFGLYEALEELVATMEEYFNTAQELVNTVNQIPDIASVEDAVATYDSINENAAALEEQQATLEENLGEVSGKLDDLDGVAADAEEANA